MRRTALPILTLLLTLGTAACGGQADDPRPTDAEAEPAEDMAMCAPGVLDCVDVVVTGPGGADPDPVGDAIIAPDIVVVGTLQQEPVLVTPSPGSTDESFPLFLQEATVEGTTVRVSFSGGHPPCFVIESADAVERDDAVIVIVRAGAAPGTDQATCTTIVEMQQVELDLAAELGDRQLLDGSRVFEGDVRY